MQGKDSVRAAIRLKGADVRFDFIWFLVFGFYFFSATRDFASGVKVAGQASGNWRRAGPWNLDVKGTPPSCYYFFLGGQAPLPSSGPWTEARGGPPEPA